MIGSNETEITWNANYKGEEIDDAMLHERVKTAAKIDDASADQLIAVYQEGRPKATPLDLALIIGTDVSNFRTGTDAEAERRAMAQARRRSTNIISSGIRLCAAVCCGPITRWIFHLFGRTSTSRVSMNGRRTGAPGRWRTA